MTATTTRTETTVMTATRDEQAARQVKADKLATVLLEAGWDGETPTTDDTWRIATRAAGVRPPSEATKELVGFLVRDRYRLNAMAPDELFDV